MSKYLGDGFFCYWQDREGAAYQLAAALDELEMLQKTRQPPFRVVLHHGIAVLRGVPTMSEINLHGPEVNFVFRMEKIAGNRRLPVLLSEQAFQKLGRPGRFSFDFEEQVDGFQGAFRFRAGAI